jgi:hypothetical protein
VTKKQAPNWSHHHCERVNTLPDDVLWGVFGAKRAWRHDPGGSTRARWSNSPNIHGCGEETLDGRLVARLTLETSALFGENLIMGSHRADLSVGLVMFVLGLGVVTPQES